MKLTKENLRACFKENGVDGEYECIVQPVKGNAVLFRGYKDLEILVSKILKKNWQIKLIQFHYPSRKTIEFESEANND